MKNKLSLVFLILYSILYIILLASPEFVKNINLQLASIFSSNIDTINTIYNVLYIVEIFVFYGGFSILITLKVIELNDSMKYIILFSILFSLLICVIAMMIKTYVSSIDFINTLVMITSSLLGVGIEIVVTIFQARKE